MTHTPDPVELVLRGNAIICSNCGASSEQEQIALTERLVAYHRITLVDGDRVMFEQAPAQHVSWYTRKLPNIGPIVFIATCMRCDHEFLLPEQFRRAEQE